MLKLELHTQDMPKPYMYVYILWHTFSQKFLTSKPNLFWVSKPSASEDDAYFRSLGCTFQSHQHIAHRLTLLLTLLSVCQWVSSGWIYIFGECVYRYRNWARVYNGLLGTISHNTLYISIFHCKCLNKKKIYIYSFGALKGAILCDFTKSLRIFYT